jgi:hypothetical protein
MIYPTQMKAALLMTVHNHSQNMTFASCEIWHKTYLKHAHFAILEVELV